MLVRSEQLASHLRDPAWVVFDCRHDLLDHAKGRRLYDEGHIPGAHFAAVETDLSGAKTGRNGRHPLPTPEAFAGFLARHGVSAETTVVAYDDIGGMYAARLWWLARWIGLTRVVLLDGGLPKWVVEGRLVDRAVPAPVPSTLTARADASLVWTVDDVMAQLRDPGRVLVDARTAERYRGETEPIDPVAGHIPGAVNRSYKLNLQADLTLRPAAELAREFSNLTGHRPPATVGHHCGSGVTACANIFAMELAGLPGSKLYNGSWSEWVSDPARPIGKGATP